MDPTLIARGNFLSIAWATLTATIGMIALAGGAIGYVIKPATILERLLLIAAAFLMLDVGLTTDLIGFLLIAAALAIQLGRKKKEPLTDLKTHPATEVK